MHNVVLEIMKKMVSRLPASQSYLSPDELDQYGIPDFVLKRVRLELENNLYDSLNIPETDWIDVNTPAAATAWNNFLGEVVGNVRLPVSYASSVFESCIDDIVSILSEPRKNIPELIFGENIELSVEEIEQRSKMIVVYSHLAQALTRYMHRKELQTLTKEKAKNIITQLDIRLTENLTPLNWAQILDPLFVLTDDSVDPELFRCFFEEKGKITWSNRFDRENQRITQVRFIEILSLPESEEKEIVPHETMEQTSTRASIAERFKQASEAEQTVADKFSQEEHETYADKLSANDNTDTEKKSTSIGEHSSRGSMNIIDTPAKADPVTSPNENEEPQSTEEEIVEEQKESVKGADITDKAEKKEDIPIWKRFVGNKKNDENLLRKYDRFASAGTNNQQEQTLADKLAGTQSIKKTGNSLVINEINKNKLVEKDQSSQLYSYVKDEENRFIDDLFGGDRNSFMEALHSISEFGSWKEASKYISSEIFRQNMINIYSESAIDFTDRLQTYFIEKSKN